MLELWIYPSRACRLSAEAGPSADRPVQSDIRRTESLDARLRRTFSPDVYVRL
jgi:hypothetical protein